MAPLISKIVSGFGFAKVKPKVLATGGLINIADGYTYHIFTSPGTFILTGTVEEIEYLIVGGGGGRATGPRNGGGGGAGGYRTGTISVSNNPGIYPISVGTGGASSSPRGSSGSPSSGFNITSSGGGGGGVFGPPPLGNPANGTPGNPGGSGGGGGGAFVFPTSFPTSRTGGTGGAGNSPPVSPPQGNGGAPGQNASIPTPVGYNGGGGGAGGVGSVRNGGPGKLMPQSFPLSDISPIVPASWLSLVSTYGLSRGGNGSTPNTVPTPSIPNSILNTGYGGHSPLSPGEGSPGIVIVRYAY